MLKLTIAKSKISNTEKNRLLIKNYNDRPNAVATFGRAKLTAEQVKEIFDKQFEFLVSKHNDLADGTTEEFGMHKSDVTAAIQAHADEVKNYLDAQDQSILNAEEKSAEAVKTANDVKARADAGGFDGKKGDKGEKGDPGSIDFIIVTELPTEDIDESAIYLVPAESPTEENHFIEYFYANGKWETMLGAGININLDDYLKDPANTTITDAVLARKGSDGSKVWVSIDAGNGLSLLSNGYLIVSGASKGIIDSKNTSTKPICPNTLDYAVKVGLTTNSEVLTDEEKAAALGWLGALAKPSLPTRNAVVTINASGVINTSQAVHESASPWTIPFRDDNGCVKVAAPKANLDAANKKYVDDLFKLSRGIRGADEVFENKCASNSATVGMALNDWLYDYGSIAQGVYSVYKYNVQGLSRVTFLGRLGGTLDMSESKRNIFMAYYDNGACVQATDTIAVTPATSGDGPFTVDIPQGVNYIYFSTKYGTDPVIWGS